MSKMGRVKQIKDESTRKERGQTAVRKFRSKQSQRFLELQESILELKKEKKELEDDIKIIRARNEQMEEIIKMLCGSVQHEEDIPAPLVENEEETSTTSYVVQPSTTHNVATTTTGEYHYVQQQMGNEAAVSYSGPLHYYQ